MTKKKATRPRKKASRTKAAAKSATRKKAARQKAPALTPLDDEIVDKCLLALIQEPLTETVEAFVCSEFDLSQTDVGRYLGEARRRLTLGAKYHRDRELAAGIRNLKRALSMAAAKGDSHGIVAAQLALNKLLALQQPAPKQEQQDASKETPEARAIREHLVPLELTAADATLSEHVRIAALHLIDVLEAAA